MNRLDRALQRAVRDMTLGPPNRPPRKRPEIPEPGERSTIPRRTLAVTYALGVILPAATAALLIPFRAGHPQTTALVLVVPVVLVAARGATGPALVAAGAAGLTYDVLLTVPYYQLVIDDPDDIVAALTLVTVAAVVGLLSSRLVHISARDATRKDELAHLLGFLRIERPGGLTEREVDVLRLLAHGNTNRQIADTLAISARTVGAHVEHIYVKAGVRSRAAATMFAMQNHLLG